MAIGMQGLFHGQIIQSEPLLQYVNAQHSLHCK